MQPPAQNPALRGTSLSYSVYLSFQAYSTGPISPEEREIELRNEIWRLRMRVADSRREQQRNRESFEQLLTRVEQIDLRVACLQQLHQQNKRQASRRRGWAFIAGLLLGLGAVLFW